MKYKNIIFDLDGTLWNASNSNAKGWNMALDELDVTDLRLTEKDLDSVCGYPFEKCVEILLPNILEDNIGLLHDTLNKYQRVSVEKDGAILYDNISDGLNKLNTNYNLYLISNCQDWYLNSFFKHFNLKDLFVDYDCNGMSMLPKSDMIKNMCIKHDLKKAIYVGDTIADEDSTREAGIDYAYVDYGFGSKKSPDYIFMSFSELVDRFNYHI